MMPSVRSSAISSARYFWVSVIFVHPQDVQ
jgi:hypothetical protein